MRFYVFRLVLLWSGLIHVLVSAQTLEYLDDPNEIFSIVVTSGASVQGVYRFSQGVVALAADCSVVATDELGSELWRYSPENPSACNSGVSFNDQFNPPYLAFGEETLAGSSIVVLQQSDGSEFSRLSSARPGTMAGTPQLTSDGQHILFTHNSDNAGWVTVLRLRPTGALNLLVSLRNGNGPYAPVGVARSPSAPIANGLSIDGDTFCWSFALTPTDLQTNVLTGINRIFCRDIPPNFSGVGQALIPVEITTTDLFKSNTAPVFIKAQDQSTSVYWATSNAEYRAWLGGTRLDEPQTVMNPLTVTPTTPRTVRASVAPPVVGSDFIYGLGVPPPIGFFRSDLMLGNAVGVGGLDSPVSSNLLLSTDEEHLYIGSSGTNGANGRLFQLDTAGPALDWFFIGSGSVVGDLATSRNGSMVYFGQSDGRVTGLQVARSLSTDSPTSTPTARPTNPPTRISSARPTNTPTRAPNAAPTSNPTSSPSSSPTEAPNSVPTASPLAASTTETPETAIPTATSQIGTPTMKPVSGGVVCRPMNEACGPLGFGGALGEFGICCYPNVCVERVCRDDPGGGRKNLKESAGSIFLRASRGNRRLGYSEEGLSQTIPRTRNRLLKGATSHH